MSERAFIMFENNNMAVPKGVNLRGINLRASISEAFGGFQSLFFYVIIFTILASERFCYF